MYPRKLIQPFENESSFFLFGPRGTGKSTWLRTHFNGTDAVYLDLLDDDLYTELLTRPYRLESLLPPTFDGWVILDEVQRIPALLSEVHRLIADRGLRFALTGSSARSLRRKGINLLAGRALTYHMYPLTAVELGDDFDLGRATQYGQLPSIPSHAAPKEYLKAYVRTYLREEVLQEGLILPPIELHMGAWRVRPRQAWDKRGGSLLPVTGYPLLPPPCPLASCHESPLLPFPRPALNREP
jgi:predicted AAA+ superfamily ATPase